MLQEKVNEKKLQMKIEQQNGFKNDDEILEIDKIQLLSKNYSLGQNSTLRESLKSKQKKGKNSSDQFKGVINKDSSSGDSPDKKSMNKVFENEIIKKDNKEIQRIQQEMNSKLFTILELIGLYSDANTLIIKDNKEKTSQEFRTATDILLGLKEKCEQLPILVEKKNGSSLRQQSLWNYYRKDLLSDKEIENIYKIPLPKTIVNVKTLDLIVAIDTLARQFRQTINKATKVKCGLFCRYNSMFGTLSQNQILLNKNFEGQHFEIKGYNGAILDCMFFPCTSEQNLDISLDNPNGEYLSKPTFIMCNPNALIYQQMINSPNSYWLSFFLKRGINVMCWNYRDYGYSRKRWYSSSISPYNVKIDAEKIMDFLMNKLKLRGKIGVYGRSIGGIASTHLANKFNNIVEAIIIDRTLNELNDLAIRRLSGRCTKYMYKFVSLQWRAQNDANVIESKCFKILATDTKDDVIENFSSLPVGIAQKLAINKYNERKWKKFYECLCLVYDLEDMTFQKLSNEQQTELNLRLIQAFKDTTTAMQSNRESHDVQNTSNKHYTSLDEERLLNYRTQNSIPLSIQNLQQQLVLNYIKTETSKLIILQDLHSQFHTLMIFLDDIIAGCVPLKDLINLTRSRSFNDFQIFLKVLEVYGVGYNDDIDRQKHGNRATISHSQQAIDQLQEIVQAYNRVVWTLQDYNIQVFNGNQILKNSIIAFLQFQIKCFNELISIQNKKNQNTDNDFNQIKEGHIVLMKCGHRGKPSRMEEKRISRLLRKSGFIPMLEDLQNKKNYPIIEQPPKYLKSIKSNSSQMLQQKFDDKSQTDKSVNTNNLQQSPVQTIKKDTLRISHYQAHIQTKESTVSDPLNRNHSSSNLSRKTLTRGTLLSNVPNQQQNRPRSNNNDQNNNSDSSTERPTLNSLRKRSKKLLLNDQDQQQQQLQKYNNNFTNSPTSSTPKKISNGKGINTQQSDEEFQIRLGVHMRDKLNTLQENGIGQISETVDIIGSLPLD